MFIQGQELGNDRVRITQPLSAADVRIAHCDRALLMATRSQVPVYLTNLPPHPRMFATSY